AGVRTLARRPVLSVSAPRRPPAAVAAAPKAGVEPGEVDAFWLEGALARLPERERMAVELAYYEDLSESAIARRLRVPVGSVKSWKRRGLNRLAVLLGEQSPRGPGTPG